MHLRRAAVERGQVVVGEDQVEAARLRAPLRTLARVSTRTISRVDAVGGQRRVDQIRVVLVVLEVEDPQRRQARGPPAGGGSLTTAQKPPSSLTASTNS